MQAVANFEKEKKEKEKLSMNYHVLVRLCAMEQNPYYLWTNWCFWKI
jgi:hypothetical protein